MMNAGLRVLRPSTLPLRSDRQISVLSVEKSITAIRPACGLMRRTIGGRPLAFSAWEVRIRMFFSISSSQILEMAVLLSFNARAISV